MENKYLKEIKAALIIIAVCGIIFVSIILLGDKMVNGRFLIYLIVYLILITIGAGINLYWKNIYFKKILSILMVPLFLFGEIFKFLIPFVALVFHVVMYFALALMIPGLLYLSLKFFHLVDFLKEPTILYLVPERKLKRTY